MIAITSATEETVMKTGSEPEGIFERYQAIGEEKQLIERQAGQQLLEILGEARDWIGQKNIPLEPEIHKADEDLVVYTYYLGETTSNQPTLFQVRLMSVGEGVLPRSMEAYKLSVTQFGLKQLKAPTVLDKENYLGTVTFDFGVNQANQIDSSDYIAKIAIDPRCSVSMQRGNRVDIDQTRGVDPLTPAATLLKKLQVAKRIGQERKSKAFPKGYEFMKSRPLGLELKQ